MVQLANRNRPRLFAEILGQDSEREVVTTMIEKNWRPSSIMITGPFGTGKCVAGDTLILTKDQGLIKIEDLYQGEEPDQSRPLKMTIFGRQGWEETAFFYYGGLKPTRRIQLENGVTLRASYINPLLVQTSEGLNWRKMANLQEGDVVVMRGPQTEDCFVKIEKITECDPEPVYDLNVPGSSSFTANGIISHNTTFSRQIARAFLCEERNGVEPCGTCENCDAIERDNHPHYVELDASSSGLIGDVKEMKDQLSYRTGNKPHLICYDESHMMSQTAQNALLKVLEEGLPGVIFIFCTTDAEKMLRTIYSRSVVLTMKLIPAGLVTERLKVVAARENILLEDKAARILGTYVRGHMRDALVLLEQLNQVAGEVTEEGVRTYLRLDRYDEVYQLLTETDQPMALTKLETLLCNYSVTELADTIGQILVNAYKRKLGLSDLPQVDLAWLDRVLVDRGDVVLEQAEKVLTLNTDFATINYGIAAFMRILFEENPKKAASTNSMTGIPTQPFSPFRKKPRGAEAA